MQNAFVGRLTSFSILFSKFAYWRVKETLIN